MAMLRAGYVKLWRCLFHSRTFRELPSNDHRMVMLVLIALANHEDDTYTCSVCGRGYKVERGTAVATISGLARDALVSRDVTRTATLKLTANAFMIPHPICHHRVLYSICKYREFQDPPPGVEDGGCTPPQQSHREPHRGAHSEAHTLKEDSKNLLRRIKPKTRARVARPVPGAKEGEQAELPATNGHNPAALAVCEELRELVLGYQRDNRSCSARQWDLENCGHAGGTRVHWHNALVGRRLRGEPESDHASILARVRRAMQWGFSGHLAMYEKGKPPLSMQALLDREDLLIAGADNQRSSREPDRNAERLHKARNAAQTALNRLNGRWFDVFDTGHRNMWKHLLEVARRGSDAAEIEAIIGKLEREAGCAT